MTGPITIETHVPVPPATAWQAFTSPDAITRWNFASPQWCCPSAQFDFAGTYDEVDPERALTLRLDDGRRARTTFERQADGTRVRTVFDPDSAHPAAMQRDGWQAILDNYAAYVRGNAA